jgi:hypothetical protein
MYNPMQAPSVYRQFLKALCAGRRNWVEERGIEPQGSWMRSPTPSHYSPIKKGHPRGTVRLWTAKTVGIQRGASYQPGEVRGAVRSRAFRLSEILAEN